MSVSEQEWLAQKLWEANTSGKKTWDQLPSDVQDYWRGRARSHLTRDEENK